MANSLRGLILCACLRAVAAVTAFDCTANPGPLQVRENPTMTTQYLVETVNPKTGAFTTVFTIAKDLGTGGSGYTGLTMQKMGACGINPQDSNLYCVVQYTSFFFVTRFDASTGEPEIVWSLTGIQMPSSGTFLPELTGGKSTYTFAAVAGIAQKFYTVSGLEQGTKVPMLSLGAFPGGQTTKTEVPLGLVALTVAFNPMVVYKGEMPTVAGSQTFYMSLYYGGFPASLKLTVVQTTGTQTKWDLTVNGDKPDTATGTWIAGWQFQTNAFFFTTNEGKGIYQVDLSSIDTSGLTVSFTRVADMDATNTVNVYGTNCLNKADPWGSTTLPTTSNTTTTTNITGTTAADGTYTTTSSNTTTTGPTTNTTSTSTARSYTVQMQASGATTEVTCNKPSCATHGVAGQTVTKISGLSLADGFTLGDILDVCDGQGCSYDHKLVAQGSLLVHPTLPRVFNNPTVSAQTQAPAGSVGNDPIAWYGKESREFWLPVGKLTPILHTRHLSMLASTFVGSPREQWMDRVVVTNADGFRLADIRIKKNIASFNRSQSPPDAFETLDVTLGMSKTPLVSGGRKRHFSRMDVSVAIERLDKVFNGMVHGFHLDQVHIGKARREAVIIQSPDARFVIISSPATEYYGAMSYLSVEYAHLDIHIVDMKNRASLRGLLPELWGLKKMSNRTKSLTCPPWSPEANQIQVTPLDVDVDAEWNKQFFTV